MTHDSPSLTLRPSRWLRSFYWRIAATFVGVLIAVIAAQSVMFSLVMSRREAADPSRSPNNVASAVAADLGAALRRDRALDISAYLAQHYARGPQQVLIVLRDRRVADNGIAPVPPEVVQSAEAVLTGATSSAGTTAPRLPGPIVTAPIQVDGELLGLVLLPPPQGGLFREVGRWVTWPGTLLLILATTAATLLAFAPARRRLRALEEATDRFARGDERAQAPEDGTDEIARVAQAFNRMTRELMARDEALRLADARRRQMLADVSHELKTPLTSMRGYIETLQMPEVELDPERRARYFATVDHETRRLERLVADLLDLARLENAGGSPLDRQVFSLTRLFDHVRLRHEHATRSREIEMTSRVADDAEQASGDPHRLDQVIDNLVVNALRHTPAGGTIALDARRDGDRLTLSVTNAGDTIAPEHLPHLFERFYKADSSRSQDTAGSRLGLSIVRAIVEQHGGTIGVASSGGYTCFTLTLPQPPL